MRQDDLTRPRKSLAIIIGGLMLFGFALANENSSVTPPSKQRLREGTRLLDAPGKFEVVGDRVSFVIAESGQSLGVLENLALERLFRVLKESQGGQIWSVSGTITEYNETNYLLVTKAVQVGKPTQRESAKPGGIGTRPKVDYPDPQGKVPAEKRAEKKPESQP